MTAALDGAQRTGLSNLIQKARSLLEADLTSTLEGDFGIHHSDGRIEEAEALSLDACQAAVRIDLLDIVAFLRSEGEAKPAAVERLIREAAFTHVNRLVALRVAEGLGVLPEAIGNGLASQGFRDFAEIAPASANEDWERFRLFVRICADELSVDVPALFDPRNPLLELEPSTAAFSELIEMFVAADETIWFAPDALGWSYQFFNSAEERKEMRESSAPRNSRELAVRNQFFTPSYVVEFLVQNGLGAHLAASFPALVDELPLLVKIPERPTGPIDLREVSALDPACGSGHFLLGAYDVLEAAWRHAGVQPEDAAPDIVRSLWGIDIDPRATQIAQAAVILRARRHCRAPLPKPNVICARPLPAGPEADALISRLPSHVGRVVQAITDELEMAPVLGSLLKVEERLDREARDAFGTGQIEGTLSEGVPVDDAASVESVVLGTLAAIADQTTSTVSQRLFAAEAHDAVRFVEAMSRRYTACLMNPPFGEPVSGTKGYLKSAYAFCPSTVDVFSLFVGRGLELCESLGTCAAITSRTGFFLATFEDWRTQLVLDGRLRALADLGLHVMEQALVEAAAYVLSRERSESEAVVLRLLREHDRPEALRFVASAAAEGRIDHRIFRVDLDAISRIPRRPIAYWLHPALLQLFSAGRSLGEKAEVRSGLSTGDDFRFVRTRWEVEPQNIRSSGRECGRWAPFAKGGDYQPYWGSIHLVVDWKDDGDYMRSFDGSTFRNPDFYFQAGLTWTVRTKSGFSPRLLPAGCVFGHMGNFLGSVVSKDVLGLLSSSVASACIDAQLPAADETASGGASKSYEVGVVRSVPLPVGAISAIRADVAKAVSLWALPALSDELSCHYVGPLAEPDWLSLVVERLEVHDRIERNVLAAYGISIEQLREICDPVRLPLDYPTRNDLDAEIESLLELGVEELTSRLLAERGGLKEIANHAHHSDRRIEVIAHGLGVNAFDVVRVARAMGGGQHEAEHKAKRLISHAVGVAFGRWDVRSGSSRGEMLSYDHLIAPASPTSPALLVDETGIPGRPATYPIEIPSDGVAVHQPSHHWDLSSLVRAAWTWTHDGEEDLDQSLAAIMKRPDLTSYLHSRFFSDHLAQYSVSRRKAPIYWQLQVPSKKWGVWLYMPLLSREMLFAVVRETEQRQRLAEQRIATLQREHDDGGAGRSIAAVSKELDGEQELAVELGAFRDEADRIANLGWEPDLDDGAVLNAAPLASLFLAWKDAAKYRTELKQGKHEWATVSKYADQL